MPATMLVTRPIHQSGQLSKLIESAGHKAFGFPAIEIRPTRHRTALLAAIKTLHDFDYAFFISPNAVTHGIPAITESIGNLPETVKLACVGAGTVAALKTSGYSCQLSPKDRYNSEALLALPALQDVQNKRIIIFRGNGGRNKLMDELSKRGARVEYAECYERAIPGTDTKPLLHNLKSKNIDIISFTSADAARNLVAMLQEESGLALNLPVIVISQRISDVCESLGFKGGILLSNSASNEAIVEAMIAWHENRASKNGTK